MRWSIELGSVAGTAVRVHATFLIFLAFIGILAYRANGPEAAWNSLAFIILLFACVVAHEFGHILVARHFGAHTRDVTLFPIGGVANIDRIPEKPRHEILVALAGPLVNLVIALILLVIVGQGLSEQDFVAVTANESHLAIRIAAANLALMAFNLLPAFPMDGGRVLRALLALKWGRTRATRLAAGIGQIFAFGFGFMGLFGNPFLLIIAAFIFIAAGAEADAARLHDSARDLTVSDAMITEFSTLHPTDPIGASIEKLIRSSDDIFLIVDETARPFGIVTRSTIIETLAENSDTTPVAALMTKADILFSEDDDLESVLDRFERDEGAAFIVRDDQHRACGLITRASIAQAILVHTMRPQWHGHRGGLVAQSLPGRRP